ncbi:MAG TPA: hypothetical protein VJM32_06485 [Candidatus Saccharimonadales bacterium]|nr:hypothetical protein [Candidatus Saccharimonadales bacterium]
MIAEKFHIIDDSGIKWWMSTYDSNRAQPYCSDHNMPLLIPAERSLTSLACPDCSARKQLPRSWHEQEKYAAHKIRSKDIAKVDVIDHNGVLTPVAKVKVRDTEYSITTQIMESKHGHQIVIYAGKKGHKNSQIFVDTDNHKLAFDHKDTKPTEIFAKIEATFKDGTKMVIEAEPKA